MSDNRGTKHKPGEPAYDNPTGNKGDLYDEAKGHPHGGQHVGRQREKGQNGQRPPPDKPIGHPSDEKLGQKPPSNKTPLD